MTAGRSKKKCGFCAEKIGHIDYKSLRLLKRFISQYGRIVPKYYSGVCLIHQKRLSHAVKLAREMALLAYVR
ncbi:30S ribosomal protein S18 [Candidatus Peregrinibacteria bacterium]|nr:30S ribosomal protein S18 [Candidatus Peregrinibacteria bacterium]